MSAENRSLLERLVQGTVVDNKYRVDEVLGRGAMGVVVAATHVHLRERVALKFLHARRSTVTTDFHSRFQREAQVSAKLKNEHITRVIDVGVWQGDAPFMVMDHLEGADLKKVLKASGPLPVEVALELIVQVCEGMAEAHALGIVHRDIKPSNLFVTKRADGSDLVKILDFGISKVNEGEEAEELTQAGVVLGSPKYMAPEQLFGSATVDTRADIWSIGAIFYEMLAGKPPYNASSLHKMYAALASDDPPPSLQEKRDDVPEALEEALARCFARDRDARIANVAELAGALLEAMEAPFAGAVKQKIQAMLDMRRDALTSSGPRALIGHATGAYSVLASALASSAVRAQQKAAATAVVEIPIAVDEPAPPASRKPWAALGGGLGGALVAGVLMWLALARPPETHETKLVSVDSRGAVGTSTPASAPALASAPAPASVSASSSASASASPAPHPVFHARIAPKPAPPPASPSVQPAPIAVAPPAPSPPPAPKPKANPLEDRQ